MKHQIILFIEPAKEQWDCPENIGNLYLNRFAVDEDAAHEVLGIYYLKPSSDETCDPKNDEYQNRAIERMKKESFDNKIIKKGIKDAVIQPCNQLHIFIAGRLHDQDSERIKHISNVIHQQKITSILLNQICLNRIRVNSLEGVELAYKHGLIQYRPPVAFNLRRLFKTFMTEDEIIQENFRIDVT